MKYYRIYQRKILYFGGIFFVFFVITFNLNWTSRGTVSTVIQKFAPDASNIANYFRSQEEYDDMGYLVNSATCHIPSFEPWDSSIAGFAQLKPPAPNCHIKQRRHWSYVHMSNVVLNHTAMRESGYNPSSLSCCYRIIRRDDALKNIDRKGRFSPVVESRVIYSSECFQLELNHTQVNAEYILLTCEPKYFDWWLNDRPMASRIVYRQYHALVPRHDSTKIINKRRFWNESSRLPPNVIILGMDSVSRQNFRRHMPKTVKVLEAIGSHEMLGYAKVAENTWPNLIPLLTGYDDDEFSRICYFSDQTQLDKCPFIWKRFSESNYMTASVEDSPRRSIWNLERVGFVEPPTDFYFRPFMVGVYMSAGFYPDCLDCIGYQAVWETVWSYVADLLDMASASKVPVFAFSWINDLTHDDVNSLQFGDDKLAQTLLKLNDTHALDNTILIILADHGFRYGGIRKTLAGYYEDKLPNFWIRIPETIKTLHPQWERALRTNSRRLTSAYDIHETLNHLLEVLTNTTVELPSKDRSGQEIKRLYGNSLFRAISVNRTCRDAGIPDSFCPCDLPLRLPSNDSRLEPGAKAAIDFLNLNMPHQCAKLTLKKITDGALVKSLSSFVSQFLINFLVSPGNFLLEATVSLNAVTGKYTANKNIQRLNQFQIEVNCITNPIQMLYCHCLLI